MSTLIIVLIIAAVCAVGIISYVKKLSHGCCGAGGDAESKIAKAEDFSGYKYRYSVKIGGMSCKNCAVRIENAFNRQDGIAARVDYKSGTAELASNEQISELTLRKTIVELGYSVEEILIVGA